MITMLKRYFCLGGFAWCSIGETLCGVFGVCFEFKQQHIIQVFALLGAVPASALHHPLPRCFELATVVIWLAG